MEDPKVYRGRAEGPMFWGNANLRLTGSYTIGELANVAHFLDPNGSDRNVFLPPIAAGGGQVYIICNVGNVGNLIVRDSGGVLVATLDTDADFALFISSPTEWKFGFMTGETAPPTTDGDWWVDVRDFGVLGNGQDDTDNLQAAIDWAFDNYKTAVRIPDGFTCAIRKPLWLARPGTYDAVDPVTGGSFTDFQYSMALIGSEINSNALYTGVTIVGYGETAGVIDYTKNASYPMLIVGPGQAMRVAGITVTGAYGSFFTATFEGSTGIAISGGNGGASRTVIERCWAGNVAVGFSTGWNSDALGDSNTFIKCHADHCSKGFAFFRTQNYINELIASNASYCNISVYSPVGKAVNIYGGNFSAASKPEYVYGMSSVSALTMVAEGYLGEFTAVLSMPGSPPFALGSLEDGDGTIQFFAIETESFGIIPLRMLSWDTGTMTITLRIEDLWCYTTWGITPDFTITDIVNEIQACTELLGNEGNIVFSGVGFHVFGCHIENPGSVTTLLKQEVFFNGDNSSALHNIYLNWNPASDLSANGRKIQSVWPFLDARTYHASIYGGQWVVGQGQTPMLIQGHNGGNFTFYNTEMAGPNCRFGNNAPAFSSFYADIAAASTGVGVWDRNPYRVFGGGLQANQFLNGPLQHKTRGFYPDPSESPYLSEQLFIDVSTYPNAYAVGDRPPICGGVPYRVKNWNTGTTDGALYMISDHLLYSHGQDFPVNWSYKGQSRYLYVDDFRFFFQGLVFGIDNGGGVLWYSVRGIYPQGGYLDVAGANDTGNPLVGTKTTTYTGSTIYQEPYNFTQYGGAGNGEAAFEIVISSGATITTGVKVHAFEVPFNCLLTSVSMYADQTGSVVVDIWKDTYANYPPTVADSICAAAKPTISGAAKMKDTTLTGWSKTLTEDDVLRFNVDSVASFTNLTIVLNVMKQ